MGIYRFEEVSLHDFQPLFPCIFHAFSNACLWIVVPVTMMSCKPHRVHVGADYSVL